MAETTQEEQVERLQSLLAAAKIEFPLTHDGIMINDANWSRVFDIRGWGRLTGHGHGGLKLPEDEAVAIQDARGTLLVEALNNLPALIARAYAQSIKGEDHGK